MSLTVMAGYPWVEELTAPDEGRVGHVDNIQIAEMLFGAWTRYLVPGLGIDRTAVYRTGARPVVRSIEAGFEAEVFPGEALHCGVRALTRTRRSFTLEQVLARGEVVLARGRVVLVTFDEAAGRSVSVPDDLWSRIESFEGRSIEQAGAPQ
jgi:acyl-CoA thioesterase FadM